MPLFYVNQSAICLAENPVFYAQTKHVEVYYHFLREKVLQKELEMRQVRTKDQVADLFTKELSSTTFQKFIEQLNMIGKKNLTSWC